MKTKLIKKNKQEVFILQNVYNTNEEILDTRTQIKIKLKKIFKYHIGIKNAINPFDLFFQVYDVKPQDLNIYKRNYWWNVLKFILRQLRKENEMFIIISGSRIFVLESKEELEYFLKVSDNHIKSIKNLKKNAEKWVRNKK
jgi:hypothetical protein